MRLIDADLLKQKKRMFHTDEYGDWGVTVDDIDAAPTVDPVKHGRWKHYKKQGIAACSCCSFERKLDEEFGAAISCPNCGAKMDL